MKLYTNLSEIELNTMELLRFLYLTLWPYDQKCKVPVLHTEVDFSGRSATKFLCAKTFSSKVVRHLLACLTLSLQMVGGGCPPSTWIHRTHCWLWLRLLSWLMLQSPHHLRNDLICVEWDVKPCSVQSSVRSRWYKYSSMVGVADVW